MQKKIISFIIPVFRNEGSIKATCSKISALFESKINEFEFEIILINDGSDDGSWNEISELASKDLRIKALSFSRNFGQVPAMIAGK